MNNLASFYGEAGRRAEALKLREELLPLVAELGGRSTLTRLLRWATWHFPTQPLAAGTRRSG